jgi:hypothetical protein
LIFDDVAGSLRFFNGSAWSPSTTGGTTNTVADYSTAGQIVIIDAPISDATGILVIENSSKAVVLPTLNYGLFGFKNPVAGLLYYDSTLKSLMVYNGNSWIAY